MNAFIAAVEKHDKVFQTGLEDRSLIHYHKMCEIVRNGGIGKLQHMEVVRAGAAKFSLDRTRAGSDA